jgi:hypothetical protein
MKTRVVFIDVDDTLVRSVGAKRIPMPTVVARVKALHTEGAVMYLWSSGGAEYAQATAKGIGPRAVLHWVFAKTGRVLG